MEIRQILPIKKFLVLRPERTNNEVDRPRREDTRGLWRWTERKDAYPGRGAVAAEQVPVFEFRSELAQGHDHL
jgi:hypothetical protein